MRNKKIPGRALGVRPAGTLNGQLTIHCATTLLRKWFTNEYSKGISKSQIFDYCSIGILVHADGLVTQNKSVR
jgi:hypothetical protein